MKKAEVEQLIGQLVVIDNGPFSPPDHAVVIGYGFRQRHGRGSPVEVDNTARVGGSCVGVMVRHVTDKGVVEWHPEAVNLVSVRPYNQEQLEAIVKYKSTEDPDMALAARVDVVYYNDDRQPYYVRTLKNRLPPESRNTDEHAR